MSLISGRYSRGDLKQKPKQWGPVSAVKSVIKDRMHSIGIPYSALAVYLPFWSPGIPVDYSKNNLIIIEPTNYKASFLHNALVAGSTVNGYAIGNTTATPEELYFSGTDDITVLCGVDYSTINSDKWPVAQSTEIVLRKNLSSKCEFILNSFSTNDRVSTISNIPSSGNGIIGGFYRKKENKIGSFCNNDVNTLSPTGSYGGKNYAFCFFGSTYNSSSYSFIGGKIFQIMIFRYGLSDNDILFFSDNPYYLIQPPTARTYFDLAGTGAISASCFDNVVLSISSGKQAVFSAVSSESLSLSVADQNVGSFISALIDQINMSVVSDRSVSVNASAFDNIDMSGVPSSIQTIISLVNDDVYFSGSFVSNLHAAAVITEIINLSDTVSTDALSIISALAADVVNISDGSTIRADFISAILENFNLSAGAVSYLSALAVSSDSINISDSAFWQGIQSAFAADGMFLNTQASAAIKILAATAESIMFDDAGGVTATFDVEVNNVVQFAETIAAISTLRASISDGIMVIATPMEISTLPNGKVSVSFSIRTPGAGFEMRTATIVFNLK